MNYMDYCIDSGVSVRNAMRKLDNIKPKILFIVQDKKVVAALTDGDIRRFLMNEGRLDDMAEKAANHCPIVAGNIKQAVSLYHDRNYVAIPIVNKKNEIKDIYVGEKGTYEREFSSLDVPVVINAGGRGTRLEPFTRIIPKPLIPIGEVPIIEHIMQEYQQYRCKKFHIIVNYKKELLKAYFIDTERSYDIQWYDEKKPLGTGGGLSLLKGKMNETFFFTNCDILLKSDYNNMLQFHRANGNAITMICAYKNLIVPYGVVTMGQDGIIKEMQEKPELSFLTNTGMYIVEPEVLADIDAEVATGFPDIIDIQRKRGRKVAVYPVSENDWMDMGQMTELEKMHEKMYGEQLWN